jgi:SAM-dependent methyltransferase
MSTDERTKKWYDANAKAYTKHVRDQDDSTYHSLYEKPAMYSLLPDLNSKHVISLGCGSGEDCHYLKAQGAKSVVGIDISKKLIDIAKDSYHECDFRVMDMEHLDFPNESFDFGYSSLAIHYIEDWHQVFREAYRILKPDSYFLFSCNHPVATSLETVKDNGDVRISQLSRTRDRANDTVRITGDYSSRRHLKAIADMQVTTWHKSIGEIAEEATDEGFLIANIKEPEPLEKMKELSRIDYQTLNKIPFFIIFRLLKP